MSWHQFAPILFCHFLQGLIVFPDEFKMYLETVKVLNECLTVRMSIFLPVSPFLLYYRLLYVLYAEPIWSVSCVTKSGFQHARSCHNINVKGRISQNLYCWGNLHDISINTKKLVVLQPLMQSLVFLFCVYFGVHSFWALLFNTATYSVCNVCETCVSVRYSREAIVCIEQHFHPEVLNNYYHGAESLRS